MQLNVKGERHQPRTRGSREKLSNHYYCASGLLAYMIEYPFNAAVCLQGAC
jgi:hypothetical protein